MHTLFLIWEGGGKNHGCFFSIKSFYKRQVLMQIFINICSLLFVIYRFTIDKYRYQFNQNIVIKQQYFTGCSVQLFSFFLNFSISAVPFKILQWT